MREVKINDWICRLPKDKHVEFEFNGECRRYFIPSDEVRKIELDGDYLFLYISKDLGENVFYQFKIEEDNLLVGDLFVDDELYETIACHVFEEKK